MKRLDRRGAPSLLAVLIVFAVLAFAFVAVLGGLLAAGGRTLTVRFYDNSDPGTPPAAGVNAYVLRDGRVIASGTSGADGTVTFRGLPADTMSLKYGGGKWVWYGEGSAFSTMDSDRSLTRGVLLCPQRPCGDPNR